MTQDSRDTHGRDQPARATERAATHLATALADHGVDHVFGVSGANIEDLFEALHHCERIEPVVAKHEFAAATMADGYARTSARIGVVAATSGGGALNLVAGLGEAYASNIPVLALVGQPPTTHEGLGAFQDSSGRAGSIDAPALFSQVSTYCHKVSSAEELDDRLAEAFDALSRGGPAVLLLPKDVQQQLCSPFRPRRAQRSRAQRIDTSELARAIDATDGRITVIVGDDVARSDARRELAELLHRLGAPTAVTPDARDTVDPLLPGYLGVAGVMGGPDVVDSLNDSTLCLLIGTRLPMMARAGLDEALKSIDVRSIGSSAPYVPSTHLHTNDLRSGLRQLTAACGPRSAHRPERPFRELVVPPSHGQGIRYRDAVKEISEAIPSGSDVFADAGNTGAAVVHHLRIDRHSRFVVALGMGGMGYTFGAAIGSALSRRRRTFAVAGDGAFFMHGMEIHTALEYRVPVTFIVFNNNSHAMCVTREQVFTGNEQPGNRFTRAYIAAGIAAMFPGASTHYASTTTELTSALAAAAVVDGPAFVEVLCDADELPPFAPFLAAENTATENKENHELQCARSQ
nr:thiamine pyrophosphate-binding protein [Rhodococcus sp. (in: high G+C Gram-positive bacteria)]